MRRRAAIQAAVWLAAGSPSLAFVPWAPGPGGQVGSSGTASFFAWSEGGSDSGLFGNPRLIGDRFVLFPMAFRAQSSSGGSAQVGDRLQVRLTALAGHSFTQIRIQELGAYAIVSGGTVSVNGALILNNLCTGAVRSAGLVTDPGMPITASGSLSGSWSGLAGALLPREVRWADVLFVLHNDLLAISIPGGSAFIEMGVGSGLVVEIVPTPGAIALLGLGGFGLVGRRQR